MTDVETEGREDADDDDESTITTADDDDDDTALSFLGAVETTTRSSSSLRPPVTILVPVATCRDGAFECCSSGVELDFDDIQCN